ncbi:MAG TPA: alanyl-tRNA editing protein [Candidatus Binatia bacterium]|nr:alanyl-tRNA editing protein [Candidatus Binatia bacterium]
MSIPATERLYLEDDHADTAVATLLAVRDGALAFDRSCFYPGGGGQPPDRGHALFDDGARIAIASAHADGDGVVWHAAEADEGALPAEGARLAEGRVDRRATLAIDAARRAALTRHHTVLHVLNTIVLRRLGGWLTGAQIGVDTSRVDFKVERFTPADCAALADEVNAVLATDRRLRSFSLPADEFERRTDLRRTLDAKPPVWNGRVRVVEIEGFDAQACGGTHVASTSAVGRFAIVRTENKGRINKRLYVRLDPPAEASAVTP